MNKVVKLEVTGQAADPMLTQATAKVALQPALSAAAVVSDYAKWIGKPDMVAVAEAIEEWTGDMKEPEQMLFAQAHALQAMFTNLARTAQAQPNHPSWESIMRIALKSQSQCRTTIEALATIKNPPVIFAKQANINNGGQQQVNNGTLPNPGARTANVETVQTKQLEASDGERLDFRTTRAAVGAHPHLATVGKIDGAADGGGKGASGAERHRISGRSVAPDAANESRGERDVSRAPIKAGSARGGQQRQTLKGD